jgi:alpha-L-fucosidase 2
MFDLHPPFQIDGNFGATSGIAEMLLQSHNGELHVLPALPSAWPGGQVQGLRGRGGYTVGATWGSGQPDEVTVRFDRDGTVKVRGRFLTSTFTVTDTTSGGAVTVTKPESDAIALPGLAGRTYRIVGQAPQQQPGYVRIGNVSTGLVLDSGGAVASGANLKQWNWDGSANLQWQLVDLGSGWYRIVNRTNGMVLDSWGATANGAVCRQAAWSGGVNQQWRLNDTGNGRFQIVNRGTGTALDGMGNATAGSTVALWTPNASANNLWTVTAL